jgi:hypothetical protein
MNSSGIDTSTRSPSTAHKLIKVENQQYDDDKPTDSKLQHNSTILSSQQDASAQKSGDGSADPRQGVNKSQISVDVISESAAPGHPVSPVSDSQAYEFKIQTGAHSLSSTDSDMTKAIHAANKEVLDSPPNLISPKGSGHGDKPLLTVID